MMLKLAKTLHYNCKTYVVYNLRLISGQKLKKKDKLEKKTVDKIPSPTKSQSARKKFKETVNLPKTSFALSLKDRKLVEKSWNLSDLYKWQQRQKREKQFILHDGPPYANGKLHAGHAINKVLKDIVNRYHVLRGYLVHYIPGWDCHGLPIEFQALTQQKADSLSDIDVRAESRNFAEQSIQDQMKGFQEYGIIADWEQHYRTMNPEYEAKQLDIFYNMYRQGLVYRGHMPVYWSPSSKTALAEAELEYNPNFISKAIYVKFPISNMPSEFRQLSKDIGTSKVHALIWTTTPWTLPANEAICYGSKLKYCLAQNHSDSEIYICEKNFIEKLKELLPDEIVVISEFEGSKLNGIKYDNPLKKIMNIPLDKQELPFLEGDHVTADLGTGLVHCAPSHGQEDFVVGIANNLPMSCLVDEKGRFTEDAGHFLCGKTVHVDAEDAVISLLEDNVIFKENYEHSYPIDWRTKQPVILRASKQWFIDTNKLRDKALECMKDVTVYPPALKQNMETQLDRKYWCISRQRVWGVPIPIFYHKQTEDLLLNGEIYQHVRNLVSSHGSDCWWSMSVDELLPKHLLEKAGIGEPEDYEKGSDIIDIWFDSGTSWASVLPEGAISDIYLEGLDQFRGWFQSSLLTSVAVRGTAPYKKLVVHGFAVDEEGNKMSKSVGNVIDPVDIIDGNSKSTKIPYGLDVLRLWVASSGLQTKVAIGPKILDMCQEDLYQIRKMLRHLLGNLYGVDKNINVMDYNSLLPQDKYMLHLLYNYGSQISTFYDEFKFGRILVSLQKLISDLSKFYINVTKDRLYCADVESAERASCQYVLYQVLEIMTQSIAPILPSLAEEVYHFYPFKTHTSFLHKRWYNISEEWNNPDIESLINKVLIMKDKIYELLVSESPGNYDVVVYANSSLYENLKVLQPDVTSSLSPLAEILQTSYITIDHINNFNQSNNKQARIIHGQSEQFTGNVEESQSSEPSPYIIVLKKAKHSKCDRCRRNIANESIICDRCYKVVAKCKPELIARDTG